MNEIFFVPDKDNSITGNDIKNGQIRIGVGNKKYFPDQDFDDLVIVYNDKEYLCSLRTRDGDGKDRSYAIQLGKELMKKIGITSKDILEIKVIGHKRYALSK